MPTNPYAGLDNPGTPWTPATAPAGPTLPQASGGGGFLDVANPVNSATAGLDQGVQASTVQKLGVGNNPNVVTDPNTGKIYSVSAPAVPRDNFGLFKGVDGGYYKKLANGNWVQVTVDQTGNTTAEHYVDPHNQKLKGLTSVALDPNAGKPVTTDLHTQDPGWQIQQGARDALGLDPARNAALGRASASADALASGAVGQALAVPFNQRLDAQAQDLGIIRNSALGRGPSAAENLAKAQLDANIRSQSAMAATARGGNIAAAMRQAADSGTQQSLQSANTLNALRAQEQLSAQGLLTTGANNLTGQQGSLASFLGGLRQYGQGAQSNVAGQWANDTANMNAQKQQAAAKYAEYLMNLYQISSGNGVAYSGQGVQAGIANQAKDLSLAGAGFKAGGSLVSGALG